MSRGMLPLDLSVAIIARDAERTIALAVASAGSVADEVVVVDTGSVDNTRQAALDAGARVVERAWDDDFSAARNFARTQLRGRWLLWIDATESISEHDAAALRHFVDSKANPSTVYLLMVALPASDTNIAGEQAARIRLVPNRDDLQFTGRVCEQLKPAIAQAGLSLEMLPWTIARHKSDDEPAIKAAKAHRNLRLLDLEVKERGQRPELLVRLGESLDQLGEKTSAQAAYRAALDCCQRESTEHREAYYGLLASYDGLVDSRQQQLQICIEALEVFPLDAQLLCAMGGYLQAGDQLELAARAYRLALEHGQIDLRAWHVCGIPEIAAVCLALVHQLRDEDAMAKQILEAALAVNPAALRARRHLIELHIKHDRRRLALEELDRLPMEILHRDALRSAIRGACLAARKNWIPALAYLQAAYNAGCRDPFCLRPFAVALIACGQLEMAAGVLHQWHAVEPRNIEAQKYLEALAAGTLSAQSLLPGRTSTIEPVLRLDPSQSAIPGPSWMSPGISATSPAQQAARLDLE